MKALPFRPGVQTVGLASAELGHPPIKFTAVYAAAKAFGLQAVAHAGEDGAKGAAGRPTAFAGSGVRIMTHIEPPQGNITRTTCLTRLLLCVCACVHILGSCTAHMQTQHTSHPLFLPTAPVAAAGPGPGEEAGPGYIWQALLLLGVSRVDHGVHAIEDPGLVEYMASRQVPITLCPLSNLHLQVRPRRADCYVCGVRDEACMHVTATRQHAQECRAAGCVSWLAVLGLH
jgi:hypothetical protein